MVVSNDETAVRLIKRTYEAYFLPNGEIVVRLVKREAYIVSNDETAVRLIKRT